MWILVEEPFDDGMGWTLIHVADGVATRFCYFDDESRARRVMSALQWQDSLGEGRMSLAQDGIVFDENTGKIWNAPRRGRVPALKVEPAKKVPRGKK